MPPSAAHMLVEIKSELERIAMQLGQLAKNQPDGWRKEYVQYRRELQVQINLAGELGETMFHAGPYAEFAPALRETLRKMRNALALHQANWPVISIAPGDPDYQASMRKVVQSHQELNAIINAVAALRPVS